MPLETLFKKIDNEEKKLRILLEDSLKSINITEKDAAQFYLGILRILEEQNRLIKELRKQIEDRMLIQAEENELIRKLIGANESKAKFRASKFAGQIVALREKLYDQENIQARCDQLQREKEDLELMVAEIKDRFNKKTQDHFREIEEEKRILQQAFLEMGLRQEKLSKEVTVQKEKLSMEMDEVRTEYFREFMGSLQNMRYAEAGITEQVVTDYILKTRVGIKKIVDSVEDNIDLLDLRRFGLKSVSEKNTIDRLKEYFRNIKQAFMFVVQVLKTQEDVSANFKKIAQNMIKLDSASQKYLQLINPVQAELVSLDMDQFKDRLENIYFTASANRELKLSLDIQEGLPAIITDINSLSTALAEIIKNADEAVAGSGEVKISIELKSDANIFIIRVSNSGKPVSSAIKNDIFKPFVTDKPYRDGLGLIKAKMACRRFGGDIILEKSDEEVTVFTITLPALLKKQVC